MSIDELIKQLKSLPEPELKKVLEQVGHVPSASSAPDPAAASPGLTAGLLHGLVTQMADDFDDELPASFWSGGEGEV